MARPKPHKHARASCTVITRMSREEIPVVCDEAAVQAQSVQFSIQRTDSRPELLVYKIRTRIGGFGKGGDKMTFHVELADHDGQTRITTKIINYTQQRSWPFPWQMVAYSNYKKFMNTLAMIISSRDANSTTSPAE